MNTGKKEWCLIMLLNLRGELMILGSRELRYSKISDWVEPLGTRSMYVTGKNKRFPFLDVLGYLKNTHKNPKFGKVRQVQTREFPTKFPGWDLSHSSKFGNFCGYSFNTLKYPKMGIGYFFLCVISRIIKVEVSVISRA